MSGLAATSHPRASEAAVAVLRSGGNAVDAAVCAAAVLAVVEPYASGLGGDCFAIVVPGADAAATLAYNGSGRAPIGADPDALWDRGVARIAPTSAIAVTIPGAVEAWSRLVADHGSRELGELLAPAIQAAEDGFEVTAKVARTWARWAGRLAGDPAAAERLLPHGRAPRRGERHANEALAGTLRSVAAHGAAGFYEGPVAEDLVDRLRAAGGPHTLADFAAAQGEYVHPLSRSYRGAEVWQCPPNGPGVAALQLLGILESFPAADWDPLGADRHHVLAEATRVVLGERDAYVSDPDTAPCPAGELLAPERIERLREAVDPLRAAAWVPTPAYPHRDTTYLAVIDGDGTLVSLISSIFDSFGSGLLGPRSGVLLHCRGAGFVLEPGHPNRLAPRRRPMHTIMPAVARLEDGRLLAFGVTGGNYQPTGQAYVLGNLVDHGMELQAAVDLPRAHPTAQGLIAEPGLPAATRDALSVRGHEVRPAPAPVGSAQAATLDRRTGVLDGAADARRDGCVLRA
ncbi:MAG: gamma-glutamyltransferase family protein [Thermoleophilaceae bacterium]